MGFFNSVLDDFEIQMRDYARQFEGRSTPTRFHNGINDELDKAFQKLKDHFFHREFKMIFKTVDLEDEIHLDGPIGIHKFQSMFYAGFSMPSALGVGTSDKTFVCIGCKNDGRLEAYASDMDLRRVQFFDLTLPETPDQEKEFDDAVFKGHLSGAGMTYAPNKMRVLDLRSITDTFLYRNPHELNRQIMQSDMYWLWPFDNIFSAYDHKYYDRKEGNRMPVFSGLLEEKMRQEFRNHFDEFVEKYIDREIAKETLYLTKTLHYQRKADQRTPRYRRRNVISFPRHNFDGSLSGRQISGFDLYNHVKELDVSPFDPKALLDDFIDNKTRNNPQVRKNNRLSAIKALRSTSLKHIPIFYNNRSGLISDPEFVIWDQIDMGISPFQAIADIASVSKSTIQRIIRKCKWEVDDDLLLHRAKELNTIDPQFWPYSDDERDYFENIVEIAEAYEKAFPKHGYTEIDIVKKWVKYNPNIRREDGDYSWKALALKIMRPDFTPLIQKNNGNNDIPTQEDIEKYLDHKGMNEAVSSYKRRVSNIGDMRKDVQRKIINPVILLSLQKQGYQVANQSLLSSLSDTVLANVYETTLPSEQIAASTYWHSPQVDIKRRFQSAVLNADSGYKEWEGLLGDKPYEIEDGIFIHPLNSNIALEEEADAMTSPDKSMRFCIWSYGSNHFTANYHMVSVRDKDGHRLCSLTVQDYMNEGKRKIKFSQNRAIDNTSPCETGKRVADELIEKVNEGEIKPNWQSIDAVRADYNINQMQNAIGYDFSDEIQRQSVYDVYRPCLPKTVVKASAGRFEGLEKALEVDDAIKQFLSDFDFTQGGLVYMSGHQTTSVNNKHQRPRVA